MEVRLLPLPLREDRLTVGQLKFRLVKAMNEQKEKEVKTKLLNFIKDNFVFEGYPVLVEHKLYDTNEKLYNLVQEIMGHKKQSGEGDGLQEIVRIN